MKLHVSTVEKLVSLMETHAGHRDETKLKRALQELDLSVYTRQSGEDILVMTDELEREKLMTNRR